MHAHLADLKNCSHFDQFVIDQVSLSFILLSSLQELGLQKLHRHAHTRTLFVCSICNYTIRHSTLIYSSLCSSSSSSSHYSSLQFSPLLLLSYFPFFLFSFPPIISPLSLSPPPPPLSLSLSLPLLLFHSGTARVLVPHTPQLAETPISPCGGRHTMTSLCSKRSTPWELGCSNGNS